MNRQSASSSTNELQETESGCGRHCHCSQTDSNCDLLTQENLRVVKMVCGGFTCSKNALIALNVVYILVGLLLIGVAGWGKSYGIVSSINVIGGVIAVGVFLLLIAVVGLAGALNHHQVMLFFYMVILFLVFMIQFGVSCSCLALNRGQQEHLLKLTWDRMSNATRKDLEHQLNCCGFMNDTESATYDMDCLLCDASCKSTHCETCGDVMLTHAGEALRILGGVGLFFSFTEILGVWLAMRFRNQKDPRANPRAFL
ncbi:tetraspanin-31-A-like [Mobula hypostoma]|uniref:tetraspanin-31-A-like n=1 Tax=Mobula hypostoma TaxID=723540 RepID=UPI002FC28299